MKDITKEPSFKVFNRKNDSTVTCSMRVFLKNGRMRFSVDTGKFIDIKPGDYMEFIKLDGVSWFIVKSKEPTGYLISKTATRSGVSFNSAILVRKILNDIVPGRETLDGMLEETGYEYKGNPVWKIVKRLG